MQTRTTLIRLGTRYAAILAVLCGMLTPSEPLFAQGCVQSRGAGTGLMMGEDAYLMEGGWQAAVGYRWLYSDRHFIGGVEQPQRQVLGNEVINDSHFIDLTATYAVTRRLALNLIVPFVYSDRSSLYEHDGTNRHHMVASGLADLRLTSTFWVLDPDKHHEGNIAFGVGMKFPTGDSEATAISYSRTGPVLRFVDQSIQPGDGGWGVTLDMQGFQKIVGNLYAYVSAAYLINPQERSAPQPISTGFSIPDAYSMRIGFSYAVLPEHGLSLLLGARMEGVPSTDWFGDNAGSRRPGYAISIEPGITWTHKKLSINVTTPVAIERNRERNYLGNPGDAAFADYFVTSSISYRF